MDIEPEIQAIEKALLDDEIDWETAISAIKEFRSKRKSWQSEEWAQERSKLLLDKCQQCHSIEQPLVLQHLWHPMSFGQTLRRVTGPDAWLNFKHWYVFSFAKDLLEVRNLCPDCESLNVHQLKTRPIWRCYHCNGSFESPAQASVFSAEGKKKISKRKAELGQKEFELDRWQHFKRMYGPAYGKTTVLMQIELSRRYLSFSDTVTFCKKCAFLWDEKGVRLCVRCGENWHSRLYNECKKCSFS